MTLLGSEFKIDGQQLDPVITERIQSAHLIGSADTDEGAGRIELTVWDGDGQLMIEGKLASSRRPRKTKFPDASWARFGEARLAFDGILFRLSAVQAQGQLVNLTFDDEAAALMRRHHHAIVTSRGVNTRAQTLGLGVAAVKEIAIPYECPEEKISQNITKPDDDTSKKGIGHWSDITVKGAATDREQRKNIETVLAVADRLKAGERATLALLVACITESQCRNLTGGDADSQGILQVQARTAASVPAPRTVIDPRSGNVHGAVTRDASGPIPAGNLNPRDVTQCARYFLLHGFTSGVGAIKWAADHPDAEIYEIAQATQGSGAGAATNGASNYGPWVKEAKTILDAWGGVGQVSTLRESFQYRLGGKLHPKDDSEENYWAGTGRLGSDVEGWQRFAWRNQVNFVSDEYLFKAKPLFVLGPESFYAAKRPADSLAPWFELGYTEDVGAAIAEITLKGAMRRWDGAPGSPVLLNGVGPVSGKWLLRRNDFDLQRDIAELVLRRPVTKHPEPAPSTRTTILTETRRQDAGSARQRILATAEKAYKQRSRYHYEETRPMPASLFLGEITGTTRGPEESIWIDCSAFVTLVYQAAGIVDPNGLGYAVVSGFDHHRYQRGLAGNTRTLAANGKRTNDPQPGDLVIYGTAAPFVHVNLYLGDGQCMNMGPSAGLSKGPIDTFRPGAPHFFYTYDLSDA